MYPYIHEGTLWKRYREMKRASPSEWKQEKIWPGLLNMILAQATATRVDGSDFEARTVSGEKYYRRAVALCGGEIMRGTSIEMLQILLIMAQYLQSTRRSIKTWNLHGLAVKRAFQLGLYSQHTLDRFPPLEKETRTRVWYACVMLDRAEMTVAASGSIIQRSSCTWPLAAASRGYMITI